MLILRAKTIATCHAFFGRQGGVSEGIYASLNCGPGSKDESAPVTENRRRAARALSPDAALVTASQVHGTVCVTVSVPWDRAHQPAADAVVTATPNIALGILTADCAPVLCADPEARVIGAAHAGWGGAIAGVTDEVIAAMERLGARRERIAAAIGPCISQAAYEVGPEFRTRFMAADPGNTRFFAPAARADHWHFDLEAYVAHRLHEAGIASVEPMSACTYTRDGDFFSYRRATHRREPDYGRQLSAILLTV